MSDYRMSDYRDANFDYRYLEDPFRDDAKSDTSARPANAGWGWIAAAVLLLIVLAAAFGVGHRPGQDGAGLTAGTTMPSAANVPSRAR